MVKGALPPGFVGISQLNVVKNTSKMDEREQQTGSDAPPREFDPDTTVKCVTPEEASKQSSKTGGNDASDGEIKITETLNTNGIDKETESQSSGDFKRSDLESLQTQQTLIKETSSSSEHPCNTLSPVPSRNSEDFGQSSKECDDGETVSEVNSGLPESDESEFNNDEKSQNDVSVCQDILKMDNFSTKKAENVLKNELTGGTESDKECEKPFECHSEISELGKIHTEYESYKRSDEKIKEVEINVEEIPINSLQEKCNKNESINFFEDLTSENAVVSPMVVSINKIATTSGSNETLNDIENKISEAINESQKLCKSDSQNMENTSCNQTSNKKNEVVIEGSEEKEDVEKENDEELFSKDNNKLEEEKEKEEEEKNFQEDSSDEQIKDNLDLQELQSENDHQASESNKDICNFEVISVERRLSSEVVEQEQEEKKSEDTDSQKPIEIAFIESEKENSEYGEKSDYDECSNSRSVTNRLSASPEQEEKNLNKSENDGNEVMNTEMVNCNEIEQIDLSESETDLKGEGKDEEMVADSLETVSEKGSEDQLTDKRDELGDAENNTMLIDEESINQPGNSEEETITGDTTNQASTKLGKEKEEDEEEVCIIPDDVILPQNKEVIIERDKDDLSLKTSKASPLESAKPKTRNHDKRSQSVDSSSRPVRNAAKLAGNKIKSLVESDLVYEEPALSGDLGENSIHKNTDESAQMCAQCREVKVCKLLMVQNDITQYLCSEQCSIAFRATQMDTEPAEPVENDNSPKEHARKCSQCHLQIITDKNRLFWETMDFCNEDCLGKYQLELGSNCENCKKSVSSTSLGKYCVRFGYDLKQFCSTMCLEEYKKGLKVCSYCQKDISATSEGFLAPVGNKGQFKDFCTQSCMEKYDRMSSNKPLPEVIKECAVCSNSKPVQLEVEVENKTHKLCSEPCFAAFKFVNNITEGQCDMCRKYFDRSKIPVYSLRLLFYDEVLHSFCSKTCMNVYILANRKIVPCNWCKVKKYNFDMIKKVNADGQLLMMCSLNCLMLYQTSVNAVCSRPIKCDFCKKKFVRQPLYHLTMSDATLRNFCSYDCIMSFQNGYPKQKMDVSVVDQLNSSIPASGSKRIPKRSQVEPTCVPVISSVQSLASPNGPVSPSGRVQIPRADVNILPQVSQPVSLPSSPIPAPPPQVYQQIITKPAPAKQMKNKSVLCKPYSHTKGVSCRPHPCMKETQTDQSLNRKFLIPVPVPIYVPAPMHMFATPFPVPVPFPLPIPVPIFIPTTRNSAKGIMKEIKKIQEKIPTDPFEAELLMMAEMVAGDKKQDPTDSESEEGNDGDDNGDGTFSPENVDTSNTFGDDMLQMALKMASELEEPAVDMESVLTSNTITTSTQPAVDPNKALYASDTDDPDQVNVMAMNRGRKRSVRGSRTSAGGTPSKRGRRTSGSADVPLLPPPEPVPPRTIEVEKPDANMCLKYTFGVNAWRHWVMQKNAELEKVAMTNRKIKLFKPELLQLTADELNFSLCLFVKEVRKPNGTEYAPDTIYYLCLGIQQYLFENGRIDNIFTDSYYEKFTDCLDEVAKKFAALYNDSQYIVTRVEEEHLWESKQLGAHSPHVLLSTLMFFNTKHFNLVTVEEHMQLSFSHIMKHWKRNPNTPGVAKVPGSRNVLLRFYPPQSALEANSRKKKVYEQQENEENPLRCPVKLYEFYLSKCPESVKTRNDVFYLLPERSCVPDSPVWYSTMALGREPLMKMLHRIKMVKEINIALLTS